MSEERHIDGFADTEIANATASVSETAPESPTPAEADTLLSTGHRGGHRNGPRPAPGEQDSPLPGSEPGRYQVLAEHARGGLGRIMRARDQRLGRTVAIKELHQTTSLAESLFVREALITARLQHPGIVPVHEAGRWPSGAPFYVMKLVSGQSLQKRIQQGATLAERLALLPNTIAVVETIAYAHSQGVIHRDIKPANIMVGEFGETVVVDWGLARYRERPAAPAPAPADAPADAPDDALAVDPEAGPTAGSARAPTSPAHEPDPRDRAWLTPEQRSVSGKVVGTPAYMAPEQARGQEVDERTDVYALGALLYELLTGAPPYAEDALAQVLAGPPAPLGEHREPIPPDLSAIVNKAMARDPAARYPTAKELAEDLVRFQTGQLVSAHRYSTWTLVRRWVWRHRSAVLVALAGLVALAITGGLGVRHIVEERNVAKAERAQARLAQQEAEQRRNEMLLLHAESALDRDPTATLAWLKEAPLDSNGAWLPVARNLYDESVARGVARHVVRHDDQTLGLRFTPDGAHLLSAGKDGTVRMLEVATGAHRVIARSSEGLGSMAISPDGAWLVAGTDEGAIVVWPKDGAPGRPPTQRVPAHLGVIYFLWFADDDTLVSMSENLRLRIWRWRPDGTLLPVRTLEATAAIAPWGTRVVLGQKNGDVIVRDIHTGADVWRTALPEPPRALSLSPDGTHLAAKSASGTLRLLDMDTGATTRLGDVPNSYMRPLLAFSPRGRWLATVGESWSIHLWDVRSGEERVLRGHENGIYMLAFSGEDELLLASASDDGTARIWDLSTGHVQVLRGHTDDVINVQIGPRGDAVATASLDGSVRLWPIRSAAGKRLGAHPARVWALRFPDAETLASADAKGEIRTWHVPAREPSGDTAPVARIQSAPRALRALSPDNRFLAVADRDSGHLVLWDLAEGTHHTLPTRDIPVTSLAVAPGGAELVTADDRGKVYLWRAGQTGGPRDIRRGAAVCDMMWSPDGTMLAIVTPLMVEVWDMQRRGGEDAFLLPGGGQCLPQSQSLIMFSPDSSLLAVPAGLHGLMLWSLHTRRVQHIETRRHRLTGIAFSPDGTILAGSLGDRSLWLWHLDESEEGVRAQRLGHHDDLILQVAFSPDGRLLATSSYDSTLRLWDLATGTFRALHGHSASVDALAFSPDGAWLASGGVDRDIRLWNIRRDPIPDTATLRTRLEITTTAVIAADRHRVYSP